MPLDPRPSRQLTSREVAGIVSSQLGGLVSLAGAENVIDALRHFAENTESYAANLRQIEKLTQAAGTGAAQA